MPVVVTAEYVVIGQIYPTGGGGTGQIRTSDLVRIWPDRKRAAAEK
jgi:hypothetical protein